IYLFESYSNEISNNIYSGNGVNIEKVTKDFPLWTVLLLVIIIIIIIILLILVVLAKNFFLYIRKKA
ncbi:unnamed protein product, partial [marine sediment metagenome]